MTPTIYYCYDAYCGWCYGFSPVIKRIWNEYKDRLAFEVLSGGMILPDKPTHFDTMAGYIAKAYKRVEELTGIEFGQDFLWHVFNPDKTDWFPSSEKPAIALVILKEYQPENAVAFASDLQYALNYEGRDLTDDEAYRHLLQQYGFDAKDFYEKLHSDEYRDKAHYEFALCKQLQVNGYPQVLIQVSESKFFLLAQGFTPYEDLKARIERVLSELAES